jgi:hypothetical protein
MHLPTVLTHPYLQIILDVDLELGDELKPGKHTREYNAIKPSIPPCSVAYRIGELLMAGFFTDPRFVQWYLSVGFSPLVEEMGRRCGLWEKWKFTLCIILFEAAMDYATRGPQGLISYLTMGASMHLCLHLLPMKFAIPFHTLYNLVAAMPLAQELARDYSSILFR